MMEFKQVIDNFKARHVQAGKQMGFSLLPLLMQELIASGLDITKTDGKFYQELATELFGTEDRSVQSYAIDSLALLGQTIPVPKANAKVVEKPLPNTKVGKEAIIENDIIRTDHLLNDIPDEDSEGDPYYISPEERIDLRPEDFAPKEYDEDFCARIGATKDRR